MVDKGPDNLIVNAQKVQLFVGGDEYAQLYNIKTHFGRPEDRKSTTDGGVQYWYGSGDHWFQALIVGTTDQISELNDLTEIDSDGNTPRTTYVIRATAKDGTISNITIDAFLRDFAQEADEEGFLQFDAMFRILTDTITVS